MSGAVEEEKRGRRANVQKQSYKYIEHMKKMSLNEAMRRIGPGLGDRKREIFLPAKVFLFLGYYLPHSLSLSFSFFL